MNTLYTMDMLRTSREVVEFFTARFSCEILKDIDAKTCGAGVWINAALWPFNVGRELARWSYENEDERQRKAAAR